MRRDTLEPKKLALPGDQRQSVAVIRATAKFSS